MPAFPELADLDEFQADRVIDPCSAQNDDQDDIPQYF